MQTLVIFIVPRKGVFQMNADQTVSRLRELVLEAATLLKDNFPVESKSGDRYARARIEHPNVGRPWARQQDQELEQLFTGGTTVDDLALFFGRTRNAIRIRLEYLKLVEPSGRKNRFHSAA